MPINPKILQKVDSLTIPDKLKKIIIQALETEEELDLQGIQSKYFKSFDKLLDKFSKDPDLIKFGEEYGK